MSPSPKRKGRKSRTPPARRTQINENLEIQPFRPPSPLTPLGWDLDAAKTSGAAHPATSASAAPDASNIDDPNNPHAVLRRAINKAKHEQRKGAAKAKAKGKTKGQSKGQGKSRGGKGGKNANHSRIVRISSGKGKARGRGKNR